MTEPTPIHDQLLLERTAQDPATKVLVTAIVTDSDTRKWGLPWLRVFRG